VDAAARRAIVEDLLAAQQLDEAAVEERAARSAMPGYWTTLVPGATIGEHAAPFDELPIPDDAWPDVERQVRETGYAALPVFLPAPVVVRLNRTIDLVAGAGWPPAFAWVFDDFWSTARTIAVRHLLGSTIGTGARQVPHVWVHVVPPVCGARGWGPHKDGGAASGARTRLSVWIALTDATLDNGCMYVLPRSSAFASLVDADWETASIALADAVQLLKDVRAVPAPAGSALAWDFDLLHWGGMRIGSGGSARRSLSLEFIARDEAPSADEHPLVACGEGDALPRFAERLRFIADAIVQYGKHEAGVQRFRRVAKRILSRSA
jgi:Phytanoyl-CoA dioxygenase (PhyH)